MVEGSPLLSEAPRGGNVTSVRIGSPEYGVVKGALQHSKIGLAV